MTAATASSGRVEQAAYWALLATAAATQFSIAAAQILLALTALLWLVLVLAGRERVEVPSMFRPLAAYGLLSLIHI